MVMVGHNKRLSEPLSRRQKRIMAASLIVLAVALAGGILFATLGGGTPTSHDGCVNITIPSTLGGATLHSCGGVAREFCAQEFARHNALAALAQPQCRLAGYRPPAG